MASLEFGESELKKRGLVVILHPPGNASAVAGSRLERLSLPIERATHRSDFSQSLLDLRTDRTLNLWGYVGIRFGCEDERERITELFSNRFEQRFLGVEIGNTVGTDSLGEQLTDAIGVGGRRVWP
ncbi:hypothetical protein EKH57_04315 [Halorubrum sp. BOL3-1]|uniref:hypothetical protein n=1 Tax=Halorubrum sp. BOL3-1 TaxID=2497325 RepID=UPI001004DBD6|nr:hypothetical protein [Halorubrum sp. BOL3-1]QAU12031.1 hypothetical protein EKH57_04315 [Halorubrum sp. BOL3-1]